jgi:hypothetical protein
LGILPFYIYFFRRVLVGLREGGRAGDFVHQAEIMMYILFLQREKISGARRL